MDENGFGVMLCHFDARPSLSPSPRSGRHKAGVSGANPGKRMFMNCLVRGADGGPQFSYFLKDLIKKLSSASRTVYKNRAIYAACFAAAASSEAFAFAAKAACAAARRATGTRYGEQLT